MSFRDGVFVPDGDVVGEPGDDLSLWLAKVRALVPAWGSQAEHRARVLA